MTPDPPPWLTQLGDQDSSRDGALPADTLGLALSGGGIRSAAFSLGVLQALAKADWLKRVDYLSTVSGGGYAGAFLGRFFDQCRSAKGLLGAVPDETPGAAQARVRRDLADGRSEPVAWLRRHANYLSPTGLGEAAANVAGFGRNLLSLYVVLAAFALAAFGLANAAWYGAPPSDLNGVAGELLAGLTPLSHLLPADWAGSWVLLAEAILWLAILPLTLAYWLASQDVPETFVPAPLCVAAILALGAAVGTGSALPLLALAAAVVWVLGAWRAVRAAEGHDDPLNPVRLALARNHLTRRLAFWVAAALGLAALAALDGFGRHLARLMVEGGLSASNVSRWLAATAASAFGSAMTLRGLLRMTAPKAEQATSDAAAIVRPYLRAALVLLVGGLPPLLGVSFLSHAAYQAGEGYGQGVAVTAAALLVSLLLGGAESVVFANRSTPLGVYAERLGRAFLGAVNPLRRVHPEGRNVTHVVPGDDVPFRRYRPDLAGGPLHLVNCAVNETVDVASQRGARDRQAENMAVGPAGVSVSRDWHAAWAGDRLRPVEPAPGPHPFLAADGKPPVAEGLDLREWAAISGAAVGPGMGRQTGPARSLVLTLANVRLGHWWDSGLSSAERRDVPLRGGPWAAATARVSRLFRVQALLLSELSGRFGGPWRRYWYLSDGGNFENTGAYEMLRRRVPYLIVCDAGRDPLGRGGDFARLTRLARIDFGAEVAEVDAASLDLPQGLPDHLGGTAPARLFRVTYPGDGAAWNGRRVTWVLRVRAALGGGEPADVRNYAAENPDFPNETTLDQFFDEAQWESYRALGEHAGSKLFPAAGGAA